MSETKKIRGMVTDVAIPITIGSITIYNCSTEETLELRFERTSEGKTPQEGNVVEVEYLELKEPTIVRLKKVEMGPDGKPVDFVDRIENAVREIVSSRQLSLSGRSGGHFRFLEPLMELHQNLEDLDGPLVLETEEMERLRELALELFSSEESGSSWSLCEVLALAGNPGYDALENGLPLEEVPSDPHSIRLQNTHWVSLALLNDMGVFELGERPLYFDYGGLFIKNKKAGRTGALYLTNKRVIVVGAYLRGMQKTRRHFFYEAWEKRPYVTSLDYVYIDQMVSPENKKREIRAKYHTKYWEEKDRTFYGPYFFRFDLPTAVSAKEGDVRIYIVLRRWDQVKDPKKNQELRTAMLYYRIMQNRSQLG